jgi:3-phenylpropionate/cinnamic acid dioxygenase small subunit
VKFGPLEKKDKKINIEMEIFRRTDENALLDHKRNEKILEELKVQQFEQKLCRYKTNWLRHKTKTNKNTVQQNIAALQTKLTKATWKSFEEIIRPGRNRLSRPDS